MSVYRDPVEFEWNIGDRVKLKSSPDSSIDRYVGRTGKILDRVNVASCDPYITPAGFYPFRPGYLVEFRRFVFWRKRFNIGEFHLTPV